MTPSVHVLYVGESLEPVQHLRESTDAEFTVCLAPSREDALALLGEMAFDCIVYEGDPSAKAPFLEALSDNADVPVVIKTSDTDAAPGMADHVVVDADDVPGAVTDVAGETSRYLAPKSGADDEARRRHEPLWEDPSFMENVLDNLLDVFFVFTVDRELVEWNTRLEETTGRSGEELASADPFAFIAPEHREEAFSRLASVLTEGRATGEFDLISADGERTPYEFVASLVTEDGAPRYVCGIGRDVSDLRQKQAELERKQAELDDVVAELERSNAELEQFAYVASHDMKEPLRMVRSYLQLLERRHGDKLDADAEEYIEFAVDGARRLQAMIDQLLTYSRIDRKGNPFREVDTDAVIGTVQRNLEVAIEESGAVVETDDLPTVTGDRDQLVQLFQNLISNAIKYNEGEPNVSVSASRQGDAWEFAVDDNGVGIPPDRIDRVFEAFYGDAAGVAGAESTGIGLAICERIVERHGGEIRVESTPGEGSTFYFTLPDPTADAEPSSIDEAPNPDRTVED